MDQNTKRVRDDTPINCRIAVDLADRLDEYQHTRRLKSRTAAVVDLLEKGLSKAAEPPAIIYLPNPAMGGSLGAGAGNGDTDGNGDADTEGESDSTNQSDVRPLRQGVRLC